MKVEGESNDARTGKWERIGLVKQVPDSLKLEQATLIGTKGGLHYEAKYGFSTGREEFHRIEKQPWGRFLVVLE